MASSAYEKILSVQSLDVRLAQLRHRVDHHPLRADLAAAADVVADHQARREVIEGDRLELERSRKRLDDEAATLEAKRADIEARLYDGSVQASKELLAMQEESAGLLDRRNGLEDQELEIMEQVEDLDGRLAALGDDLAGAESARAAVEADLAAAVAELETEMGEIEGRRRAEAAEADGPLLTRYEQLAPQFDGAPLARFVDGHCDGCHMQLSAVAVDRLTKAPESEVILCEECGRLLVR